MGSDPGPATGGSLPRDVPRPSRRGDRRLARSGRALDGCRRVRGAGRRAHGALARGCGRRGRGGRASGCTRDGAPRARPQRKRVLAPARRARSSIPRRRSRSASSRPCLHPERRSRFAPNGRSRSSWPRLQAGSSTALHLPPTCSSRFGGASRGSTSQLELPPPLAEPRLDFRVDKATALAYEVRAGEYIQVIDVEGKQCSDFLAFHRGRLESGVERGLDATVTRSITGTAYPEPGLFGKFYDADMNPLVEVVRDTVGRHDTFQLACYAKYYEDMGYPGHVNCSDNFNGALDPFGVAKREGLARAQLLLQHALTPTASSRRTSRGRDPATTCCYGRTTTSSAPPRPVRTTSTRRTAGRSRTSTCACTRPSTRSPWQSRGA